MSDSKGQGDTPNSLSNRDTIDVPDDASLSDSDPDELSDTFGRRVEDLSSSSEEEEQVRRPGAFLQGKPAFRLAGGSSGFSDRSRSIFDTLDNAAKLTSTRLAEDNVLDGAFARPAPPSPPSARVRYRAGSEGAKKVPLGKRVPDYLAHPERWTHYSLEDIPETSERENNQVALQFIQELDQRRSKEATVESFTPAFNQDHSSSSDHKIIFTKPSQASKEDSRSGLKVPRAKANEVGLVHLDAGQEEEGGGSMSSLRRTEKREEKKRKWTSEDESNREQGSASSVVFSSGKKVNRKNFRKAAEEEDED